MVLLGDEAQVNAHFVGGSANLDARLVHCLTKCTIGIEIVLDAPDGTPR
jgi:precorrin-6B methylase 2